MAEVTVSLPGLIDDRALIGIHTDHLTAGLDAAFGWR